MYRLEAQIPPFSFFPSIRQFWGKLRVKVEGGGFSYEGI